MYALSAANSMTRIDADAPSQTARKIYDMPLLKRFLQDPNPRTTKYTDQLYEMLDEANSVFSTINRYRQQGRMQEASELLVNNRGKLAARARLNNIATQVRNLNNQIKLTMYSESMTPQAKREKIDALGARKNELTAKVAPLAELF